MGNKKLLEILRMGILEIRILSARDGADRTRINWMSNILHNIPSALVSGKSFDYELLDEELKKYNSKYTDSIFNAQAN